MINISSEAINKINSLYQNIGKKDNCSGCLASFMYYDTIEEQIASIVYSIVKGHYFFEGNKRTGFTVFIILCKDNGIKPTNKDLVKLFENIAASKFSIPEVAEMLFDKKFPKKFSFIRIISKIVKKDNKYQVQSEEGKNLGTYDTKEEAEERLRQIEYFKHKEAAIKKRVKRSNPRIKKSIKKTSPKIKKITKKPSKTTKTKSTSRRFKIKPSKTITRKPQKITKTKNTPKRFKIKPNNVLTKKPSNNTKLNRKPYKSQNKPVSKRYKIRTTTSEWPHQDMSLPVLEELLEQGYNMITLVAWSGACADCRRKNGRTMSLISWLNGLNYEAPVFEAFHVNSYSELKVWDKTGELDPVYVNYEGNIR